ncbi:transglycosylase domain-containing protein [Polycladidibacter hongkongensis]|uniref:transglycosylase domain-containing protein n=1 Tax=Polycladidibacter hongkongensis TaxID=1647556 RepID=UPI0009EB281D|nr:penicillin-binding protein 1A [Pseudovibrio hongkongensis]
MSGNRGDNGRIEPHFNAGQHRRPRQVSPLPRSVAAASAHAQRKRPAQRPNAPKQQVPTRPAPQHPNPSIRRQVSRTKQPPKQKLQDLPPKKKGGGGGGWLWWLARKLGYWGLVLGIWGGVIITGALLYFAAYLPPADQWAVPKRPPNVRILAADGTLIANRGATGGEAIRLEQLPRYLPEAVIAIEDRRFYYHFGIDPIGLTRAVVTNYTSGRTVQGGSTITQQLAKNLFLSPDRTIKRKMQEVVMSLWLEYHYSKAEILEMYLNRVYLGAGAYGVDAAARRYFNKPASQLSLSEAATIAGLLKAPSSYAPTRNPDRAEARAQVVIAAMNRAGFISDAEATTALIDPARVARAGHQSSKQYVADYVMELLPSFTGRLQQDVVVETTIDLDMQQAAEMALRHGLQQEGAKANVSQGAIVMLNRSGAVRALVGGKDYAKSQFNRAVYARRQPGSAFKPFVYLAALENGFTPESILRDRPVRFNGWSPKNYSNKFYGNVSLTQSLAYSLNTVAAELTSFVGPQAVAQTARRLGISSPLKNNLAIGLGTSEVTVLEIAAAYVPFSNQGYGIVPHVVRRVRDADGNTIYKKSGSGKGRVINPSKLSELNWMMAQTVISGTGKKARLQGRPVAGKTGTSQSFRDAWFIGYSGSLTAAVWLGNDNNKPMKKVTGGGLPAQIWHDAMEAAHKGIPVGPLPGVAMRSGGQLPKILQPGKQVPVPIAAKAVLGHARAVPKTQGEAESLLTQLFGG